MGSGTKITAQNILRSYIEDINNVLDSMELPCDDKKEIINLKTRLVSAIWILDYDSRSNSETNKRELREKIREQRYIIKSLRDKLYKAKSQLLNKC